MLAAVGCIMLTPRKETARAREVVRARRALSKQVFCGGGEAGLTRAMVFAVLAAADQRKRDWALLAW